MSPTTTTTLEHFAADGPIGPSIAIALGIALSLLITWTLFRESYVLGRRCTLLFWVLRLAALAVVLWMLLAPMKVLVETSTTRKAIVIATDVSGSMQTVDPAGTSDDVRWALAGGTGPFRTGPFRTGPFRTGPFRTGPSTTTESADRAVVALGVALRQLQLARESLQQRRQDRTAYESVSATALALSRVREHLRHILDRPQGPASSDKCRILANRVIKMFESAEFSVFGQVAAAIAKNRAPQNGWQEGLPDLEHRVASIKTVLLELARIAAENEGRELDRDTPQFMANARNVSRLDRAVTTVESLHGSLSTIREKADVRYASFDQAVHGLTSQPSLEKGRSEALSKRDASPVAPGTNLTGTNSKGTNLTAVFDALQRERQQQPFAAVILFSDVAHNQSGVRNPRDVAATLTDTPTYVVPVGNTRHVRDVRLHSVFAPTVAMRNDDIVIEASLQAFECEGQVCVVQLLQDGKAIDQREVVLDSGFASRTVRFERRVQALGTEHFRIAIEPIEGELSTDNNGRDFEVNVTRSDIKVLLADEFPRWEYRYLTQLFRRDDKVQCDELLFRPRMIATGRREATNSFPVTVDDWDQYDVVMLGDVPSEHLPVAPQESLVAYLAQRGGTLVMIAGQAAMPHAYQNQPLAEILPVAPVGGTVSAGSPGFESTGFEFRITADGRVHPALMIGETEEENAVAWDLVNRNLPLAAVSPWRRPLAAARTLIAAVPRNSAAADDEKNSAFLCWQPVGRGRIVYLAGPESYRLRFLRGDRLHYRFWGQLLRWAIAADLAAGSQYVRVRTDKSRYESREAVQVTVRLANAAGEPVVADDVSARMTCGNDTRTVPLVSDPQVPGAYRAEVGSLPPGAYRIEPVGAAVESLQRENQQEPAFADVTVYEELSTELTETRCDRALAQQIADMTGGQVVPPTAISEVLALTNLEPIVSTKVEHRPLWVQWKYLWIVFGCLQLEWIVRKRLGLS